MIDIPWAGFIGTIIIQDKEESGLGCPFVMICMQYII